MPIGGDNYIEFGWDTEVIPLLTYNASLILSLYKLKPCTSTE